MHFVKVPWFNWVISYNTGFVFQEDVWQRSRLNYRDEESGSIPPAQQDAWQGKKSLKKKEKNKKKVGFYVFF